MKTYNNSVVLRNDGVDPSTSNADLNAAIGVNITVRVSSAPVAGLGALASIFNIADVAIANPMQTDDKGNYQFKVVDGVYDVVIAEGTAGEQIISSEEIIATNSVASTVYVFDNVADFQAGVLSGGSLVVTANGASARTLGYYAAGDGGGLDYTVQARTGGYGQNKVIEFPLNVDESKAVPIVSQYSGVMAGILPSVALNDLTKNFNELAGASNGIGQKFVNVEGNAAYFCADDLVNYSSVVFVGEGSIISPKANNYYKRIYPQRSFGNSVTINNSNGTDVSNFLNAIRLRNEGGNNPSVVIIGDSLVQGAHRSSDNYWFVKDLERKLRDSFGDIDFYNRGIAGSKVLQVDQVVQDGTPIKPPYEAAWNTVNGQILRDYVSALNPDLIIIAYGMNSGDSASDTQDIINARTNLKTVSPNADLVWLTTPIRTTDLIPEYTGQKFGTYPKNEQSNQAGLVTRALAQSWGEYCIDVNRMSNIVQLGQDPVNLRMNRWFGSFKTFDNKWINDNLFTVEGDSSLTLDLSGASGPTSKEMFRDVEVEFTLNSATFNSGDIRINLRDDPEGAGALLFQILPTEIRLIAYKASSGVQAAWTVNPVGKLLRFRAIGTEIKLYIDDVLTAPTTGSADDLYQSMFLAPIAIQVTTDAVAQLTGFNVNGGARSDYMQHVPRLSPFEVFNITFGDGGNNLNHPNNLGEREMYTQPITEFISWLSGQQLPEAMEVLETTVISVTNSSGSMTTSKYGNLVVVSFEDFTVTGSTGGSPIVSMPTSLRPVLTTSGVVGRVSVTDQSKGVQFRSTGDVYMTGGTGTATWAGSVAYFI